MRHPLSIALSIRDKGPQMAVETPTITTTKRPRSRNRAPYLLLAPALVLIAIFIALPVVIVGYYSLFNYNVSTPWTNGFVGLQNFRVMLTQDPHFWNALGVTVKWVIVEVGLQMLLGLGLAIVLNRTFKGRGLTRALVFAPWAIAGVVATQIWLLIYSPSTGISNVLNNIGVSSDFAPLVGEQSAFWSAVVAELWRGLPFFAIMLLADLQSIPKDLYEAADVDGANSWRQFWNITLPHLRDAIVLTTLLRAVWEFNNVDLIYTLTGGGPAGATTTLPLYVVQQAVTSRNFGYGSALTIAGFVVLLVFSLVYLRLGHSSTKETA